MKRLLVISILFLSSCASGLTEFPAKYQYLVDLTRGLCVKYEIIDHEKYLLHRVSTSPLVAKGDCDHMVGFHRNEFKPVQNWVRDTVKEFKED